LTGKRVKAVMLCTLLAELTVSGNGKTDKHTVEIEVQPRPWKTKVTDREDTETDPRLPAPHAWPIETAGIDGAISFSDCGAVLVLCPRDKSRTDPWGSAYELKRVKDPGGPFHGWSYVSSTKLLVNRLVLFNKWIWPDSPPSPEEAKVNWYSYNKSKGVDVDAILQYIRAHERGGVLGVPRSGHTSAISEIFESTDENGRSFDPKRAIEDHIGTNKATLKRQFDRNLSTIDRLTCQYAGDPLGGLRSFEYWAWSEFVEDWIWVEEGPVTSPAAGCEVKLEFANRTR
jgi:hypothetical protein